MQINKLSALLLCLVVSAGCQNQTDVSQVDAGQTDNTSNESGTDSDSLSQQKTAFIDQIVEASCGECQFGLEGSGCDLAVRIDDKSYYVVGALMDHYGDAHGDDGMCNCVRQAKVSGEIKDGRFVSTSFELLPFDKEKQQAAKEAQLRKSRFGAAFAMSGEGLIVKDILADGLVGKAGLKKGDKIVKLNDKPVAEMDPDAIRAAFAAAFAAA